LLPDADALFSAAEELASAGCTLLQYRNKSGNARQMLEDARELKARLGPSIKLIMNDRADLCLAADLTASTSARTISLPTPPAASSAPPACWEYPPTIPTN